MIKDIKGVKRHRCCGSVLACFTEKSKLKRIDRWQNGQKLV